MWRKATKSLSHLPQKYRNYVLFSEWLAVGSSLSTQELPNWLLVTLVGFGSAPVNSSILKYRKCRCLLTLGKSTDINSSLTSDLDYNNYTFSLHWRKAILMLGWMGNTGHTCASQAVLESLLSPPRALTSSGHHYTTQISKTAVPPTRSLLKKIPSGPC